MQGHTEALEHKVSRCVLHEKAERNHSGNDSEGESTAEQESVARRRGKTVAIRLTAELAKQGKDVTKPKHYRVRAKSKSERLFTGCRK